MMRQTSKRDGQTEPPAPRAAPRRRTVTRRPVRPGPALLSASSIGLLVWTSAAVAAAVGSTLVGLMAACMLTLAGVVAYTLMRTGTNRTRR